MGKTSIPVPEHRATFPLTDPARTVPLPPLYLVGGKRIVREALQRLLEAHGIRVRGAMASDALPQHVGQHSDGPPGVYVCMLNGQANHLQDGLETIQAAAERASVVVLSDTPSRAQIYATLRSGAKGYVHLDAEPEEFIHATRMALEGRTYLAADIAALVVNDLSGSQGSDGRYAPADQLSPREKQVVELLCEGCSSKEIGKRLHISAKTVENHRYNIYRKCGVESIAGLMRHALQSGLVSL